MCSPSRLLPRQDQELSDRYCLPREANWVRKLYPENMTASVGFLVAVTCSGDMIVGEVLEYFLCK
jgi:hypothetical protein